MSRQNFIRLLFAAAIVQLPIWLQTRSRSNYFEQLTAGARSSLASNVKTTQERPAGDPSTLEWPLLKELDPESKAPSAAARAFNNTRVTISGFMVPLEDKQQKVMEFLLVPAPMSCIHVPSPAPQQIIYVIAEKAKDVAVTLGAVQVTGTFYVAGNTTPTTSSLYTMEADKVVVIK